jgi:hypothetical protein
MLNFLLYLIPGAGLLPSLGKIVATIVESAGPIMKGASEFIVWFLKAMWEGIKDVTDNIYTMLFVATICAGVFFYADKRSDDECSVQVTKLEQQIKALRKNPVRTVPSNQFKWPWENLF